MTNPPYDPSQGEGVSPWAAPTNDTPPSGYPQVQQPYPQQPTIPQQGGSPRDQYAQPGVPQSGQAQPGYAQPVYPQPGYPQPGYPQSGYPQPAGYLQQPPGYPQGPYGTHPYGTPPGPHGYGPLNVNLASWGARVGATLIDFLLMSPLTIGGMVALFQSVKPATYDASGNLVTLGGPTGTGVFILLLCYAGAFAVSLWQLYQQGTTGQTLGKKAVGIRVLKQATMQPTGFGGAFVRALAHLIDSLPCGAGYLAPLWDSNNRTFADQLCNTLVIRG